MLSFILGKADSVTDALSRVIVHVSLATDCPTMPTTYDFKTNRRLYLFCASFVYHLEYGVPSIFPKLHIKVDSFILKGDLYKSTSASSDGPNERFIQLAFLLFITLSHIRFMILHS